MYNLNNNTWQYFPMTDSPFCSGHIQLIDDKVLIVGGDNVNLDADFTDGRSGLVTSRVARVLYNHFRTQHSIGLAELGSQDASPMCNPVHPARVQPLVEFSPCTAGIPSTKYALPGRCVLTVSNQSC